MLRELVLAGGLIASSYIGAFSDTIETYLIPQKLIYSGRLEKEIFKTREKKEHVFDSGRVFYTFDERDKFEIKYFPKIPKNMIDTFNLRGNETYETLKDLFKNFNLDFDYVRDQRPQELEEKIRLNINVKF